MTAPGVVTYADVIRRRDAFVAAGRALFEDLDMYRWAVKGRPYPAPGARCVSVNLSSGAVVEGPNGDFVNPEGKVQVAHVWLADGATRGVPDSVRVYEATLEAQDRAARAALERDVAERARALACALALVRAAGYSVGPGVDT